MSLTGAMNAALSGINAQQRAIQVVSGNVANATNPDYTRKSIGLQAWSAQGLGVQATAVMRATDTALAQDLVAYTALAGQTGAQSSYMTRLSTLFGGTKGTADLAAATEDFTSAWTVLQSSPDSAEAKADVVAKANALAGIIGRLQNGVDALDSQIQADTASTVDQVNGLLKDIDRLNDKITAGRRELGDTVELEDQRDALVQKLAGLIDVKTIPRSDGGLAVYTAGGLSLVDQSPTQLAYDGTDITRAGDAQSLNGAIRSGKLAGLLALRAPGPGSDAGIGVIAELRSQVDAFAGLFTDPAAGGFSAAYDGATPVQPGELATGFFVATGGTLAVNPALLDGTASIKLSGINAAATALTDGTRSFTATGLALSGQDYAGIANGITSALTRDVGAVKERADMAAATRTEALTRFESSVGVNMDTELANLQVLQNAYAASARVMQVVNQLYDDLFGIMR